MLILHRICKGNFTQNMVKNQTSKNIFRVTLFKISSIIFLDMGPRSRFLGLVSFWVSICKRRYDLKSTLQTPFFQHFCHSILKCIFLSTFYLFSYKMDNFSEKRFKSCVDSYFVLYGIFYKQKFYEHLKNHIFGQKSRF